MRIDISEVASAFPEFRVAVVVAEGLAITRARPAELDALIADREAACRAQWAGMELSTIPGVAAWRKAYRAFGIKKTSYRSSVERLVKNVLAGRSLPPINSFVDVYNAVSLAHVLPLGADDLDRVVGDIAFRYSRPGDQFFDMAAGDDGAPSEPDPPKPGEVVFADGEKILCRRWNWRQDVRSLVVPETRRAVVTIQSNGAGDFEAAVTDLVALLGRFAGATLSVTVADRGMPFPQLAMTR